MKKEKRRAITIWLWIGVIMIFVQIVLGGITRLTGSGLSITKWDIVTGTLPPLNEDNWTREFNLYKQTPQYEMINTDMSMSEFKFIYFWEYVHRLWARTIGFVFLFPFVYFTVKGWMEKKMYRDLAIAVVLGLVVATFGWIMVASGLVDRPWVSAYKLTVHLGLALVLYAWMVWIAIGMRKGYQCRSLKRLLTTITILVAVQLLLGGLMSGMKAGLYYPTWPDMHGEFVPKALLDSEVWSKESFIHYERGPMPGVVQFTHRTFAYVITIFVMLFLWISLKKKRPYNIKLHGLILCALVVVQVMLGILTVTNSVGKIPLTPGVLHQIGAILLLTQIVFLHRIIRS